MREIWNWYVESFGCGNVREGFVVFVSIIILLVIISQALRLISKVKRKVQEIKIKSNAELAYQQHGPLASGCKVFVFEKQTGYLVSEHSDRFRSSRELDPDKFDQIVSFSANHAIKKFNRKQVNL